MTVLIHFLGALLVLAIGASFLWLISESVAGRDEMILHYGNVVLVVVIGMAAFAVWGWVAVGAVLGVFGALWIIGSAFERRS